MLSTRDADVLRLQYMAARYKARLGERIRDAREAKGLTQADLARVLPGTVESSQVSRWERGKVQPQPDTLDALAAALDVDAAFFLAPDAETGTADLMGSLNGDRSQLDRIEVALTQLLERQDQLAEGLAAALEQLDALRARPTRRRAA